MNQPSPRRCIHCGKPEQRAPNPTPNPLFSGGSCAPFDGETHIPYSPPHDPDTVASLRAQLEAVTAERDALKRHLSGQQEPLSASRAKAAAYVTAAHRLGCGCTLCRSVAPLNRPTEQ